MALLTRERTTKKNKKHCGKILGSIQKAEMQLEISGFFCHERGHWSEDCLKAQKRDPKKPIAVNMTRKDEESDYLLCIMLVAYVANLSKQILDTRETYHLYSIRELFMDLSNLEFSAIMMGNINLVTLWGQKQFNLRYSMEQLKN